MKDGGGDDWQGADRKIAQNLRKFHICVGGEILLGDVREEV